MSDATDRTSQRRPRVVYDAVFADTATAVGDQVHVTIEAFDGGQRAYGPVLWEPRATATGPVYPAAGEAAKVIETGEGDWVVVVWETDRAGEGGGGEGGPPDPPFHFDAEAPAFSVLDGDASGTIGPDYLDLIDADGGEIYIDTGQIYLEHAGDAMLYYDVGSGDLELYPAEFSPPNLFLYSSNVDTRVARLGGAGDSPAGRPSLFLEDTVGVGSVGTAELDTKNGLTLDGDGATIRLSGDPFLTMEDLFNDNFVELTTAGPALDLQNDDGSQATLDAVDGLFMDTSSGSSEINMFSPWGYWRAGNTDFTGPVFGSTPLTTGDSTYIGLQPGMAGSEMVLQAQDDPLGVYFYLGSGDVHAWVEFSEPGNLEMRSANNIDILSDDGYIALVTPGGAITVDDAGEIQLEGDVAHQGMLFGLFSTTPAAQPAAIADATGGATIDTQARVAINALLAANRSLGFIDT